MVLYSNVVFQAQTTQAEILLFFLFCLMVYILLKFLETGSLFSGLLTSVISAYMFMVHMRCIAIWVAWIITVLLLFGKKQYHKGCILLILILGILLLWAGLMMKNVIKENAYLTSSAEEKVGEEELAVVENNTNEFSGQVENIKRLFTMEGLKQFIVGYLGKIYYLCVSTFLIIFWAVRYLVLCIKDFFMENRKDQTVQRSAFFSFFLLLSLILTVAVSALFMITVYRQDNLVYGRYNEHILGPFLLIGLMELTKEQEKDARYGVQFLVRDHGTGISKEDLIKISNVGTIAGAYVLSGKVERNAGVRVIRENVVIHDGQLATLKRFKDEVKEVGKGFECGIQIEDYNDIKEGDMIEVYIMEEIKR